MSGLQGYVPVCMLYEITDKVFGRNFTIIDRRVRQIRKQNEKEWEYSEMIINIDKKPSM